MTVYSLTKDRLIPATPTSFCAEQVRERDDLQRLLRDQIKVLEENLYVVDEEFAHWDSSLRRVDLLCIDRAVNLVVVELKVTEDGGHSELQALRYAAMLAAMTFEQAVAAHELYLRRRGIAADARSRLLEYLGWSASEGQRFAPDVRIVLVSADFGRELTTTVLWLNARGLNIRCVRARPYRLDDKLLLDVHRIIPLPEAEEYQVCVQRKQQEERGAERMAVTIDGVWDALTRARPDSEVLVARRLADWCEANGFSLFPLPTGFAQIAKIAELDRYLFKVTTQGQVEIWFQYLAMKPPFDDPALREELRQRLEEAVGVPLPPERLGGKPKVPLASLLGEAQLAAFLATWRWAVDRLKNEASRPRL